MTQKAREHWDSEFSRSDVRFPILITERPSSSAHRLKEILQPGESLLEVGSGMGRNTNWLAQQGYNVTGIDISPIALQEAERRGEKLGVQPKYYLQDASQAGWPFPDHSFDAVLDTMTSMLFTLSELERYCREVVRVLKPGGKFFLYTLDYTQDIDTQQMLSMLPGAEKNTYFLPIMGHQERAFSLEDIAELYAPLEIESSDHIEASAQCAGEEYEKCYWWVLLRSPEELPRE